MSTAFFGLEGVGLIGENQKSRSRCHNVFRSVHRDFHFPVGYRYKLKAPVKMQGKRKILSVLNLQIVRTKEILGLVKHNHALSPKS